MKKLIVTTLMLLSAIGVTYANDIETTKVIDLTSCKGCHGVDFEKSALGKSKIVKDLTQKEIYDSLIGYKNDTYGGPMKGVMKGQLMKYSNEDLVIISNQIVPTETK